MKIYVYDISPIRMMEASSLGFKVTDRNEILSSVEI